MLGKNPRWRDAEREQREAWINQLGNIVRLMLRQGRVLDTQYNELGIPQDIDFKEHTDVCLNQQRTVCLTHPGVAKAAATYKTKHAIWEEKVAQWREGKKAHAELKRRHEEASNARIKERKRNLACFCGMSKDLMDKEVKQRKKECLFDTYFQFCGSDKSNTRTCARYGRLHKACVSQHTDMVNIAGGKTYCKWCKEEADNPDPGAYRKQPKEDEAVVPTLIEHDEDKLMDAVNAIILKQFPEYKPAAFPESLACVNPMNMRDQDVQESTVMDEQLKLATEEHVDYEEDLRFELEAIRLQEQEDVESESSQSQLGSHTLSEMSDNE